MTDPTSSVSRPGYSEPATRAPFTERSSPAAAVNPALAEGEPATPQPVAETAIRPRADELVLSDAARNAAMEVEPFDAAKVEAIKEALRNGDYPLDSRMIAESFYRIEQMIQG